MIRLNDINKTVIEEKIIEVYSGYKDNVFGKEIEAISLVVGTTHINFRYETKEARDKDLELLDKVFNVKSIEDKVNEESKPSYDFGEPQVLEPEPTKPEQYVTWEDVKKYAEKITVELHNGEKFKIKYVLDEDEEYVEFYGITNIFIYGDIFNEDLFNALKLKKVE